MPQRPPADDRVPASRERAPSRELQLPELPVTLVGEGLPADQALADAAAQVGVSYVGPVGLKPISVAYYGVPFSVVVEGITALIGLAYTFESQALSVMDIAQAPVSTAVFYAGHEKVEDLAKALQAVGDQRGGKVATAVMGDRVLVHARPDVLVRMAQVVEHLRESSQDSWVVESQIVSVNRDFLRQSGVEWTVGLGGRVSFAGAVGIDSVPASGGGARVAGVVEALLRASLDERSGKSLLSAHIRVREGEPAYVRRGQTIPVPMRTVSPEGTVTITGYQEFRSGVELNVTARRISGARVELLVKPVLSAVAGAIGEQPIIAESSMESFCDLAEGEWCVLAGLSEQTEQHGRRSLPGLPDRALFSARSLSQTDTETFVIVRAVRVASSGGASW